MVFCQRNNSSWWGVHFWTMFTPENHLRPSQILTCFESYCLLSSSAATAAINIQCCTFLHPEQSRVNNLWRKKKKNQTWSGVLTIPCLFFLTLPTFWWQVVLMAHASMMACGATIRVWMSGPRCRPCSRPASTTAPVWWRASSTWWPWTARSATTMPWTVGSHWHPCCTPWTTVQQQHAVGVSMPPARSLVRTPWPSSATMSTLTAGTWSTAASCLLGPSPPNRWLSTDSSTLWGEEVNAGNAHVRCLSTCFSGILRNHNGNYAEMAKCWH